MDADVSRESLKQAAAEAALGYVEPGAVIGVGAGSTVEYFIAALAAAEVRPRAAVAASERTRSMLETAGITTVGLAEELLPLGVYVDGADEADGCLRLIKGGGGALAREKIIASAARTFVCIIDESKLVARLGAFPLAVEVLPMALHVVQRALRDLGGEPSVREGFETDNGNVVIDVRGLDYEHPDALERAIDAIPGVVECGVFALRPADVALVGTASGVRRLDANTVR